MTTRHGAWRLFALLAAVALFVIFPATVAAHAELVRAIPADGDTVTEPVTILSARYSEDLTGNSNLQVLDATGATVATAGIDPENPRRMIARPDPPLTDGTYTVESTTVSAADGDIDRTTWTFTVTVPATPSPILTPAESPSEPPASESPTPEATASPSPTPAATPTASPDPGAPTSNTGDVILPIVAALAIVAVGAGFLLSRNRGRGTGPTG